MPRYIMALDQGTTSSRAIVFDRDGAPVSTAQQEFPQLYPQPGWVEHDPEAIWSTQLEVARAALQKAGASASDVAAIGITNQRETTLMWDRATGAPIHNAIVWQCRRTAPLCAQLKSEGFEATVRAKTGLVIDPYFSGTKVAWLLDNVPGARAKAEAGELAFGTVDTFLIWRLSGGALHVTDVSNASRTMLYNINARRWDEDILARLNIPPGVLPTVAPSSAVYGPTAPDIFGAPVPIAGAAGDQQAASFGQACFTPGMTKNTYGTGCFVLMNTGGRPTPSPSGLLTTVGWQVGSGGPVAYAMEGSIFIAGAAVQWLRDELGLIKSAAEIEALAGSVPDTGGAYLVPTFVGLGAPYWDAYARGALVGMTRGTNKAHIARATLESIAYQSRDVITAMQHDAGIALEALRVDGGAAVNDLLMQFQADILGAPVQRPRVIETTALGAVYLAGLAVGFWESAEEIAAQWALDREFTPKMSADQREALYAGWQKAVARARGWAEA
ncbi:MAG: glycerol kinase GlpK [Anaerolineae bacterium]|nr:glycerol kinase GlpK [Anaerolineae bacterium]